MSLTLKEAAEQVFEQDAFEAFKAAQIEKRKEKAPQFDEDNPEFSTRTDAEAQAIADTPHLTGDPEWDAIELEQTDPNRPLLSERMGG